MLIIYVPALCYCIWFSPTALSLAKDHADRPLIIGAMLTIHFLKRSLETLFLHKYSGSTDLGTAIFIGIYYTLVSIIVSYFSVQVPLSVYDKNICLLGITFFFLGQIGNFYHHYLLAALRKDNKITSKGIEQIKNYKIPKGGLFDYVTMPHYFFELISWLGIALTAQQVNSFLVFCSMFSYLAGRSVATNQWYKDNIPGYPSKRKNLVPFIF